MRTVKMNATTLHVFTLTPIRSSSVFNAIMLPNVNRTDKNVPTVTTITLESKWSCAKWNAKYAIKAAATIEIIAENNEILIRLMVVVSTLQFSVSRVFALLVATRSYPESKRECPY